MKTTINLDNELLAKAPRLIHMGLEALIQRLQAVIRSTPIRRHADTFFPMPVAVELAIPLKA
jgi:hypothetical protein